jgi:hypothetical protein
MDKYYTNPEIVELCGKIISKYISIGRKDLVIEPSAGDGAFIPLIKDITDNHRFYDIEPEHPKIKKANYLSIRTPKAKKIHVIGNPPFGKRSFLCKEFIRKSTEFADTIAFILPRTFKKKSMWNCFPPNYRLEYQKDIPKNAFTFNGCPKDVNCVFQIWKKHDNPRRKYKDQDPIGFDFVKKKDIPDIAIKKRSRRGIEIVEPRRAPETTRYFIKFSSSKYLKKVLKAYIKGDLSKGDDKNTLGMPSLSKGEVTKKLNKVIKR